MSKHTAVTDFCIAGYISNKHKYALLDDFSEENVSTGIRQACLDVLTAIKEAPEFTLRPYIVRNGEGIPVTVKISIHVKAPYMIDSEKFYESTFLTYSSMVCVEVYELLLNWVANYVMVSKLYKKIDELNRVFSELCKEVGYTHTIKFRIGVPICELSDTAITIGLTKELVLSTYIEELIQSIETDKTTQTALKDILTECCSSYDIIKIKHPILQNLGVYSRRKLHRLLRMSYSKNVLATRVGICYAETPELFALIEKKAITEAEVDEYDLHEVLLYDNENMSVVEQEHGLNKLVVRFILTPFEKVSTIPVEMSIREYLKLMKAI